MKLSANIPNPLNELAEIFLDGIQQKRGTVFEADEENGYIIKYSEPKIIMGDRILMDKLFGNVEITFGSK